MDYYTEIKEKLLQTEIYGAIKDYSKARHKVITYFETGKLLSDAGKAYGQNIIKRYAEKLMIDVGKKYNERTLRRIRQFYEMFQEQKWSTLWTKLSWSHYRELLVLKDMNEIKYYINICEKQNLTQRQLHDRIKSKEYERLPAETRNKLIDENELSIKDLVPNPIIIKKGTLDEKLTEYALKQLILNNLDDFLSQLGRGFTYVGNEYKIKIGNTYNYIDLLLFNYEFNAFIVVELKVTELKKEHLGQIQVYMNYIDENIRKFNQDKTIGIIICRIDNEYVIKYCSDHRVIARFYELV